MMAAVVLMNLSTPRFFFEFLDLHVYPVKRHAYPLERRAGGQKTKWLHLV
jgi:hypothetical protein